MIGVGPQIIFFSLFLGEGENGKEKIKVSFAEN